MKIPSGFLGNEDTLNANSFGLSTGTGGGNPPGGSTKTPGNGFWTVVLVDGGAVTGVNFGNRQVQGTGVSVSVAPSSVSEGGGSNLVYTFTRTGDTSPSLTVDFTIGGDAVFSTDYTQGGAGSFNGTTGSVIFGAGSSTTVVIVTATADTTAESDETVVLTIVEGGGYTVDAPNAAAGTIINDDPPQSGVVLEFVINASDDIPATPEIEVLETSNFTVSVRIVSAPSVLTGFQLNFGNSDVAAGELLLDAWTTNPAWAPIDATLATPGDAFVAGGAFGGTSAPLELGTFHMTTPDVSGAAQFLLTMNLVTGNELFDIGTPLGRIGVGDLRPVGVERLIGRFVEFRNGRTVRRKRLDAGSGRGRRSSGSRRIVQPGATRNQHQKYRRRLE